VREVALASGGGSLRGDGRRAAIPPADVDGRWTRRRHRVFWLLIAIYVALPWIPIGGHPAVFLDLERRHFYLFGLAFNAQDTWLLLFLLAGAGFALLVATAVLGRVWCGWACPQTVFLDGVYRRIERWIEGPGLVRIRLRRARWDAGKLRKAIVKQLAFAAVSLVVAHVFLSYFVSLPRLWAMVLAGPAAHPHAFGWALGVTLAVHGNYAWFREQLCVVVCPYGRLQSVLIDADSLIVGYDERRGEPRGKRAQPGAADCVDCRRCVAVCPTGIDIRNGLQLDCIACAQCVDACDDIMGKLGRPAGLIRYDSLNGLRGARRRLMRPRLVAYGVAGLVLVAAAALGARSHEPFEANLLRQRGAPYTLDAAAVQNAFELHLVNKRHARVVFELEPQPLAGAELVLAVHRVELGPLEHRTVPFFVRLERAAWRPGQRAAIELSLDGRPVKRVEAPLLGPPAAAAR
jgi:cytochrome c oxidase accessory protein FixG